MRTYLQLSEFLGSRDQKHVPSIRATTVNKMGDGSIGVYYHGTRVVTAHQDGTFTLNTGGYLTPTTKARINDFSPARVFQLRRQWYVMRPVGTIPPEGISKSAGRVRFFDGIRVDSTGAVIGDKVWWTGKLDGTVQKRQHASLEAAENAIAEYLRSDPAGVAAGDYYIDGPGE